VRWLFRTHQAEKTDNCGQSERILRTEQVYYAGVERIQDTDAATPDIQTLLTDNLGRSSVVVTDATSAWLRPMQNSRRRNSYFQKGWYMPPRCAGRAARPW
jgi:hypothetical protein